MGNAGRVGPAIALVCLLGAAPGRAEGPPEGEPCLAEGGAREECPEGESRRERLERRRRERLAAGVTPARLRAAERAFLWLEEELADSVALPQLAAIESAVGLDDTSVLDLAFLDYRRRLIPRIGSVRTRSGPGGGVRLWRPGPADGGVDVDLAAAATFRRYVRLRGRVGRLASDTGPRFGLLGGGGETPRAFLYGQARYDFFPEETFFGLGAGAPRRGKREFLLERGGADLVAGRRLDGGWLVAARAGVSRFDVRLELEEEDEDEGRRRGRAAPLDDVPGLAGRDYLELVASVAFDRRDRPGNPHRGGVVAARLERWDGLGGGEGDFSRLAVDAAAYVPLGSPQRVVALGGLVSVDREDAGARVPFYLQRTLGNNDTLRGFTDFRFRGEKLVHLSAEYRWEAAPAFELALFYDAGRVFRTGEPLRLEGLERSYGLGLRFKTADSAFLRTDFAWSGEGFRIHVTTGHPF